MSYESYRARINANGGNAQSSMSNITKHSQRQMILNSPTRKEVIVNDDVAPQYCIVSDVKTYFERKFLFLPDFNINNGDYIHYQNFTYLVTDRKISDEFPEGIGELCNATFPLKTESTFDYFRDDQGNIVYDDVSGEPITIPVEAKDINLPCVVENKYRVSDKSEQMWVADNDITIILPYHSEIKMGKTFEMYDDIYKIVNIDFTKVINNTGILTLRGEKEK